MFVKLAAGSIGPMPETMPETVDRAHLAALLADLPREQGQLLAALHRIQHDLGWLPRESLGVVAKHLQPPVHVESRRSADG